MRQSGPLSVTKVRIARCGARKHSFSLARETADVGGLVELQAGRTLEQVTSQSTIAEHIDRRILGVGDELVRPLTLHGYTIQWQNRSLAPFDGDVKDIALRALVFRTDFRSSAEIVRVTVLHMGVVSCL